MDLESECSALESVEDNGVITPESLENVGEKPLISNGDCSVQHADEEPSGDAKSEGSNGLDSSNSPFTKLQSSPGGSIGSTPPTSKGYGLKKWRRIPRETNREGSSKVDNSTVGKRGLPNSAPNPRNHMLLSAETKQRSDSVSSTNAVVKSPGVVTDGFDSGLAAGPVFATGTDSENSEDRSSKSSTAASAARSRYEIPGVGGYGADNNMMKNSNGNNNLVGQRGQQGKSRAETTKKPRGERVKIEKENSHSSMESDSRSSNFVFMQGASSMTSNGRQSRRSTNYDGENSDEVQGGEQQFVQELQAEFRKNLSEFEDVSQSSVAADLNWESKGDNGENNGLSADCDPLVDSINTLQSAQEALAKELQNFRDVGKDDVLVQDINLPSDFTSGARIHESKSSVQPQYGESQFDFPNSLESQIVGLKQNVNHLESKLEEAMSMLEVKKGKVIELEDLLNTNPSQQEDTTEIIELQQAKYKEMETELEGLFKQKIEAEVEYLVILRTIQNLRVAAVDQITVLEEQRTLVSEQAQILNKLEDAGNKASLQKRRADKLETYCGDIVETDEILKVKKRVCEFTTRFFIQLVLLLVVLGLFVMQLSPHHPGFVPT